MKHVEIFTDGACKGNPGKGGWGAILRMGQHEKEMAGSEKETTNNRMELTAAIEALKALNQPCRVTLHTDSKYVLEGITRWVFGWQKNGWKTDYIAIREQDGLQTPQATSHALVVLAASRLGSTRLIDNLEIAA